MLSASDPTHVAGYEIQRRIGAGGTGVVYAARRSVDGVVVALKVLRRDLCRDGAVVQRFQREARLLSSLAHPGVVPVLDSGADEDRHFLVMPLLEWPTLAVALESTGAAAWPGPSRDSFDVVLGVLRALDAIHQRGVIHRDLTPSNIFVKPGAQALLADFGIVKILGSESILTRSGALMGTVPFMAPEQLSDEPVSVRTDLYQIGLILFRVVCGRLPFGPTLAEAVRAKCLDKNLPDPRTRGANISEKLAAVILKTTSRSPADRHGSAADLGLALSRALEG